MAKNKVKIILEGEPQPWTHSLSHRSKEYNYRKQDALIKTLSLEAQYKNKPPLSGPITLSCNFYFPFPPRMPMSQKLLLRNTVYSTNPLLSELFRYIEAISRGVLFNDTATIVSTTGTKYYDLDPRTEITIIEINK